MSGRIWDTAGRTSIGESGFNGSHDGSGLLAGGQVGYNWQAGRLVYGVEADISSSWIDGSGGNNDCCGHTVNWLASVRGRAGLTAFDNRTLFYVTAGAAWADVDYSSNGSFSDTHFGWVAGAGIERALTPNLSARVEYLYYNSRRRGACRCGGAQQRQLRSQHADRALRPELQVLTTVIPAGRIAQKHDRAEPGSAASSALRSGSRIASSVPRLPA